MMMEATEAKLPLGQIAPGPLDAVFDTFSAVGDALILLAGALVVCFVLAPSVSALVSASFRSRYWRTPVLWLAPSVVAVTCIWLGPLGEPRESYATAITMIPYGLWSVAVVVIGLPHLFTRFARFIAFGERARGSFELGLTRWLYAWPGLASAALMLAGAIVGGWVWMGGFAICAAVIAGLILRPQSDDTLAGDDASDSLRRLVWSVAAVGVAVASPPTVVLTWDAIAGGYALGNNMGTIMLGGLWLILAVGGALVLRANKCP